MFLFSLTPHIFEFLFDLFVDPLVVLVACYIASIIGIFSSFLVTIDM